MTSIQISQAGLLAELIAAEPAAPISVIDGSRTVAFVVVADELAAMHATQNLLATTGSMAAISEGLADLAAGREQLWGELRFEHGRGSEEEAAAADKAGPVVSHRARWDLELLAPAVAQACFDALDSLTDDATPDAGLRLTAGFPGLRLAVADGYRMVLKPTPSAIAIVHVDTAPESAAIEIIPMAAPG